jgi:hypothetical protein
MYSLLLAGETLFPNDLGTKVPEAMIDVREAAKALAYEIPTACGFHTFRVTESVLRRYYAQVTGGKAQPKVRNIGVYLNALKLANAGDEKIRAALKQMSELHRNPLIHPDVVLTTDEAIATLGIARSVITAMLAVLPVQPPTTATPTTALASMNSLAGRFIDAIFSNVRANVSSLSSQPSLRAVPRISHGQGQWDIRDTL